MAKPTEHYDVSHNRLKLFRQSVRGFYDKYISQTDTEVIQSDAMRLGTAMHLVTLEPERAQTDIVIAPEFSGKGCVAARAEFKEAHQEKVIVNTDEIDVLARMKEGIERNKKALELLQAPGESERDIYYKDPTGLIVVIRIDRLLQGNAAMLDLKISRNPYPESFAKDCANLGYYNQNALYLGWQADVVQACPFYHIVIGNVKPFDCRVYELDANSVALGTQENREAIDELAMRIYNEDWSDRDQGINSLRLPPWKFKKQYKMRYA